MSAENAPPHTRGKARMKRKVKSAGKDVLLGKGVPTPAQHPRSGLIIKDEDSSHPWYFTHV